MNYLGIIDYKSTESIIELLKDIISNSYTVIIHINGFDPASRYLVYETHFLEEILSRKLIISSSEDNHGFSGGCNLIIDCFFKQPSPEILVLCNDDLLIDEVVINERIDSFIANNIRTMSGTKILDEEGRILHATYNFNKVMFVPNRFHKISTHYNSNLNFCESAELVHGSFMIFHRELLDELLSKRRYIFDERFFAYREETELQMYIKNNLRKEVYYINGKGIIHYGSRSTGGKNNFLVMYYLNRNSLLISSLFHSKVTHLLYFGYHLITYGGYSLIKFDVKFFHYFLKGVKDHLSNRYGRISE